jgi:integrase/recombinase XerD
MFNTKNYKISVTNLYEKKIIAFTFSKSNALLNDLKKEFKELAYSRSVNSYYVTANTKNKVKAGLNEPAKSELVNAYLSKDNLAAYKKYVSKISSLEYSKNTLRTYTVEFLQLLYMLKEISVSTLTAKDIKSYLLYCIDEEKIKEGQLNSRLNALIFYFDKILKSKDFTVQLPRPKKTSKVAKGITENESQKLLNACSSSIEKAIITLTYTVGLSLSEIVNLKVKHIHFKRKCVDVIQDDILLKSIPFTDSELNIFTTYFNENNPKQFLFEGINGKGYSLRTIQSVCKRTMRAAKIYRKIGKHIAKQDFRTVLINSGASVSHFKKSIGKK